VEDFDGWCTAFLCSMFLVHVVLALQSGYYQEALEEGGSQSCLGISSKF